MVYIKKSKKIKSSLGFVTSPPTALQQCMKSEGPTRGAESTTKTASTKQHHRSTVSAPCDRVLRSRRGIISCISRRLHGYVGRPQKRLFTPEIKRRLKEWLVKRRRYPYPTRDEKRKLAQDTGLDYNQICNWFANWRRKLKNAESGGLGEADESGSDFDTTEDEPNQGPLGSSSWGRRILLYNNVAARNAEKIPIECEDSLLEDESDFNEEYDSGSSELNEHTRRTSQDFDRLEADVSSIDTTAMDHCYSLLPPNTAPIPDKNGNYKTSYMSKSTLTGKPSLDFQQAQKWRESVERYKPQKQAAPTHQFFVSWAATSTHHPTHENAAVSSNYERTRGPRSSQRRLARDEIDAAEALTALARASRTTSS